MIELTYLTSLSLIILIGLIASIISNKLKIPNILLLLLIGMGLRYLKIAGTPIIYFPSVFISTIAILALAVIVFDGSSNLKFKEFDDLSYKSLELTIFFFLFNVPLLAFATQLLIFGTNWSSGIYLSLMLAFVLTGTSPDAVLAMLPDKTGNKIIELLTVESIINTPFTVLFPFIILEIMNQTNKTFNISILQQQLIPFLTQFAAGIGAGVIVALIAIKIMRSYYHVNLSPLATIAIATLTYIFAENLSGNGVLAVTSAGLLFGNLYVRRRNEILHFSNTFSAFLEIIVFLLVGLLLRIPFNAYFFYSSILLFLVFLFSRYLTVHFAMKKELNMKEKLFMTFATPKGLAVAVVVALFLTYTNSSDATNFIPYMELILNYIVAILIYTIILSTITIKYSKFFIGKSLIK